MSIFLITFLSLYGALHAYAYYRLRTSFHPSRTAAVRLAAVMVLMTIAPLLIRFLEWSSFKRSATLLAWPGYIWMGALLLFCSALLLADIVRLLAWAICRTSGFRFPDYLSSRLTCEMALLLSLSATFYSFFEARNIRTEYLTVTTSTLPAGSGRIRIVQISDVHLGLLVSKERLQRILTQVKAANPDILVSTGDLVDGRLNQQGTLDIHGSMAAMLADVKAPMGRFAVVGNHEYYAGIRQALDFTSSAGFKILCNETTPAGTFLSITGVDDPARKRVGLESAGPSEAALMTAAEQGRFKLLLKHRPVVDKSSDGLFDLQLSGHTHQGQIFPFTLLVLLEFPLTGGTAKSAAGSLLHVSRGSGTWGPPLRFLAPPEVTIIDLVPTK